MMQVKSNKKRHEFISEWDFAEFIKKVIDSGKYSDKKFYIKGNANYSYSDNKKQVYESYVPQRIYLADDDADEYSTATIKMIFNTDSLDDMSVEEKGKYYVNGYISNQDVSNVEDMGYMFFRSSFTDEHGDISNWDVSKVRDMECMFYNTKFNGDISNWDVSNVKDMDDMFYNSPLQKNPPKWYKE